MKPRLLALFCGAGGCTRGYQKAGWHVTGVDLHPQPRYCGDVFDLGIPGWQLRRHRLFESSVDLTAPGACQHVGRAIGVYGGGPTDPHSTTRRGTWQGSAEQCREAMGIDWMTKAELNNAIPPAYAQHIGLQLMQAIGP